MPATKRVINIGNNPDDGTGDLLRDALNKVNLNFDDVWQYTSVNSNLDITGDSINGTTDVIINPTDSNAFKVTGDTIINPDGGNYNFTINGDLHNNVLYVQASTGRIGVHNTSPTVTLDITGDTKVSGMTTANNLTVTGNTVLGDTNTDIVTYNAKAATDFLPESALKNIGAPSNRWGYVYTTNLDVTGTIAGTFTGSMTSTLTGDVNNTNVTTVNLTATGPSNFTDVNVSGNLVVQGTTTTLETTQVLVDNSIIFEGATDDAFETTLQITDPTADRTFTFPDATGTVATQEWVNAQSFGGSGPADTDALTEGTTNLYYTDTRADGRITAAGSANWNTAYGWGDHSTAGYQTTASLNSSIDSHLNQSNPTSGYVLSWNGSDYVWVANSGGSSYGDSDVATYLNGNLDSHIIPDTDNTYDIGSAVYKIRDLYVSDNSIHIGDNTLRTSAGNLLLNDKMVNADTEYNNGAIIDVIGNGSDFFKREVTVNGVRIMGAGGVGGQTAVPDAWLEKVARMFELFTDPTGAGINTTYQRNLIKNLSGDTGTYHAGSPTIQRVARGAGADYSTNFLTDEGAIFWNLTGLYDTHVQNDMVWYLNSTGSGYGVGDTDAQEVIEHVFHTLHMHGLPAEDIKLYPYISSDWNTSDLYNAMVEAYDAGKWDPSGYQSPADAWKTDGDAFEVAAKEYLYLLNFCMFEYTSLWDGGSLAPEWTDDMRTQAGIQANNPLGYAFHNTYIAPVISKPSLTTIRSIFQDGNTPAQDDPSQAGASGYVVDVFNGEFGSLAGKPATLAGYGITDALSKSSYETNDSAGAIDITKRHHFISPGVNYTLADGTYIGQELHFWRSAVGTGYSDITIANAKWTIPGDVTDLRTNFVWRTNGSDEADNRTFMAVWDGTGWCLSGGTVAA